MKFKLKDVKPNPFRRIEQYPIDRVKVALLKESIKVTEYWENIVGRKVDGKLEIAYGHHRLTALQEMYPGTKEFDWRVRSLSDGMMIQMMARENRETYKTNVAVLIESVKAAVKAYANGQITAKEMPPPPKNGVRTARLRYAPSFRDDRARPQRGPAYTAASLGKFLGMTKSRKSGGRRAPSKLELVLKALALEEQGLLKHPEEYTELKELKFAVGQVSVAQSWEQYQKEETKREKKEAAKVTPEAAETQDVPVNEEAANAQWARTQEQRKQKIEEHREAVTAVAKDLINAGFRSLAEKRHPDKDGGSDDAMILVNEAKGFLERMLSESSWAEFESFIEYRGKGC